MLPKFYEPYLATLSKHKARKPNKGKTFLCCDEVVKKYKLPENTNCSYAEHITDDYPESHFDFLYFRILPDKTNIKVCSLVYGALMRKIYGDNWVSNWLKDPAGHLKIKQKYASKNETQVIHLHQSVKDDFKPIKKESKDA